MLYTLFYAVKFTLPIIVLIIPIIPIMPVMPIMQGLETNRLDCHLYLWLQNFAYIIIFCIFIVFFLVKDHVFML